MAELLDRVDSAEYLEWQIMYSHDPWGPVRADQQAALIAMMIAAANRGRNATPLKLEDFRLYRPFQEQKLPVQNDAQRLLAGARAYNAKLKAKSGNSRRSRR